MDVKHHVYLLTYWLTAPTRKSKQDRHHQNKSYKGGEEPASAAKQPMSSATCSFNSYGEQVVTITVSREQLKQKIVPLTTWDPNT